MKPRSVLVVSLVVLACWLIGVVYLSGNAMEGMSAAPTTLEPESYLPLVHRQPTLTPTPTPTRPPVYVMDNHSSFGHPYQGYSVVGEVYNNTGSYVWNVVVGAKFYKYGQSQPVYSISHPLHFLFRLPPGSRSCFSLDEYVRPIDWDYYAFDDVTYFTDSVPPPPIAVFNVSGAVLPGLYHLAGQVRNDHTQPILNTRVQGTLYNQDGIVLDCRWQFANTRDLSAGQMSFFEIDFTFRQNGYGDVRSHGVEKQAEWFYR